MHAIRGSIQQSGARSTPPRPLRSTFRKLLAWGLVSQVALATAEPATLDQLLAGPLEPLQEAYLQCNEEALLRMLSMGEAADCSMIYEAVKRRAFNGNFDRLVVWSREASLQRAKLRARAASGETAAPPLHFINSP